MGVADKFHDTCNHAARARFVNLYGNGSKLAFDRCLGCGKHLGWVTPSPPDLDELPVDQTFGPVELPPPPRPQFRQGELFP